MGISFEQAVNLFAQKHRERQSDEAVRSDKELDWITINGTHVPLDDEGRLAGEVGEKIRNSKKPHTIDAASVGEKMRPANTDYAYEPGDTRREWTHRNAKKLKPIYMAGGSEAIDEEWYKFRMADTTNGVHETSQDAADEVVFDNVSQSDYDGWFRSANSAYKPRLVDKMLSSPEMRNAGLNLAYQNYKDVLESRGEKPMPFEEFLVTPIKMYRGGYGQKHTSDDVFSAYTFDRKIAERFAGKNGVVTEAEIRPIDTYGSMRAVGEAEIWVPRGIAPNGRTDSRMDEEEEHWITVNGAHILVDENGELQGETGEKIQKNKEQAPLRKRVRDYQSIAREKDEAIARRKEAEENLRTAEYEYDKAKRSLEFMPQKKRFLDENGIGKDDAQKIKAEVDRLAEKRRNGTMTEEEENQYHIAQVHGYYWEECYGKRSAQNRAAEADMRVRGAKKELEEAVAEERKARLKAKEMSEKRPDAEKIYTDEERKAAVDEVQSSGILDDMGDYARGEAEASIGKMSDAQLHLLQKTARGVKIWNSNGVRSDSGSSSWYREGTGTINMSTEDMEEPRIVWHEYGHYLDDADKSGCDGGNEIIGGTKIRKSLSSVFRRENVLHGKGAAEDFRKLLSEKYGDKHTVETSDEWKMISISRNGDDRGWTGYDDVANACSDRFHGFIFEDKEWDDYRRSIGYPLESEHPDINDYIEFYKTPKRKLERRRERFKGAEEAYLKRVREIRERADKAIAEHPEYFSKAREYNERCNRRESRIGPVSDILCACCRGHGPWIYGSHSSGYYSRSSAPSQEAAANYHQMRCMGWDDAIGLLKDMAPHVADGLERAYNEWLWRNLDI